MCTVWLVIKEISSILVFYVEMQKQILEVLLRYLYLVFIYFFKLNWEENFSLTCSLVRF